jgi:hypothetical protein
VVVDLEKRRVKMRKILKLVLVAVSFIFLSCGVALADGWYKTKWGMSPEQAEAAIGEKFSPASAKYAGETYSHKLGPFKIGSHDFEPFLAFISGSLVRVHLRYSGVGGAEAYSAFSSTKDMLVGKYGAPVGSEKSKMMGGGEIQTEKWVSEDTMITLNYYSMRLPSGGSFGANITYEPRISGGSDKL